jgi:hypothetical protein
VDLLIVATALAAPAATVRSSLIVILAAEATTAGAPTTGLAGEPGAEATANSHASSASCGGFDARQKIEELRRKKFSTAGDNDGFAIYFSRRNSNL